MKISSQAFTDLLIDNLHYLQGNQLKWMTQMGTGQKIQVPTDSPTLSSVVQGLQSEQTLLGQYQKNSSQAKSLAESSFEALSRLNDANTRTEELLASGKSKISQEALYAYASEMNQVLEEAVSTVNGKYLDAYLFSGAKLDTKPFEVTRDSNGKITNITYNGSSSSSQPNDFYIGSNVSINPTTSGEDNETILGILKKLVEVRDAMSEEPPNPTTLDALNTQVLDNEKKLVNLMGDSSAKIMRIEHANSQNSFLLSDISGLMSENVDVDIAEIIVRLQQTQYAYQAALQTGGRLLNLSLLNYIS